MSNISPELSVVADFLCHIMPFSSLPEEDFSSLIRHIDIQYHVKANLVKQDSEQDGLRIIRSGAAEIRTGNDQLLDRLGEGESFNLAGLAEQEPNVYASFIEDSLIYFLDKKHYQAMREKHRPFDRFFHGQRSRRLSRALMSMTDPTLMTRPIKELMTRDVFKVTPETSVQQLALAMSEKRISSALVMEDKVLMGIVTDRDLRNRVLAKGLSSDISVAEIMTTNPVALHESTTVFDATLLMTQRGYHHLPIISDVSPNSSQTESLVTGIITSSDLMLAKQDDPVYLVQHISRQSSTANLKEITQSIPNLFLQWVNASIPASQISHVLTAISDAITTRLIELAIQTYGPAPVPFSWLAFGSQARGEQLLNADQDNGLLISNDATPEDITWFKQLAQFVCDGLNACGYDYCPGKVMAITDEWCQPLRGWVKTVDSWTKTPTPDAVMRVSIFFDLRSVYGDSTLADQLQQHMLERTQQSTIFQAALAANVLETTPPLGIFRRFVVERNGEHRDELDLKKRGILPIIDMLRLHALANGITAVNSQERSYQLTKNKALTKIDGRNLKDALAFIMQVRVSHQAKQMKAGKQPDNYCNPYDLPKLSKEQLRDAFTVIHDAQSAIKLRYRQGLEA
ncbi:MAG: DUF294 nucleotidyltransferase-like domain-containing protein [Pseudomonadales bacterium]|nr:DUF294 nucleotidyltransferase-like domain-containing protein [Pseudomonadales bacterium]